MSPCVVNDTNFATLVAACISSSCSNAPCANVAAWDTSALTAISFPIAAGNALGDIGGWDISNVRDMSNFVNGSDAFTGSGVAAWDTSSVTSMTNAFQGTAINTLNLGSWDVSAVRAFDAMFYSAENYTGAGISAWTVNSTATARFMFFGAPVVPPTWLSCDSRLNAGLAPCSTITTQTTTTLGIRETIEPAAATDSTTWRPLFVFVTVVICATFVILLAGLGALQPKPSQQSNDNDGSQGNVNPGYAAASDTVL